MSLRVVNTLAIARLFIDSSCSVRAAKSKDFLTTLGDCLILLMIFSWSCVSNSASESNFLADYFFESTSRLAWLADACSTRSRVERGLRSRTCVILGRRPVAPPVPRCSSAPSPMESPTLCLNTPGFIMSSIRTSSTVTLLLSYKNIFDLCFLSILIASFKSAGDFERFLLSSF